MGRFGGCCIAWHKGRRIEHNAIVGWCFVVILCCHCVVRRDEFIVDVVLMGIQIGIYHYVGAGF